MNELALQKIIDAYAAIEIQLLQKLATSLLDQDELDNAWVTAKLANVRRLKRDTAALLNQLATLDDDARRILTQAFLSGALSPSQAFLGTNGAALNNLVADYLGLLRSARFQILRQTLDAYRSVVGQVAQGIATGTATRVTTAKTALNRFAAQGISAFVSRDGRKWDIASYVEMSTRTAGLNAFREGRIAAITGKGGDLIIISSVPNPSHLCKPYERKVLSISGKDKRYPSLATAKDNGLFHPNCRHSFTKYTAGLTKPGDSDADKGFDDYEATQDQRYYERQIRKYKRLLAVDPNNTKAKDTVREYQGKLRDLVSEYDLVRKRNRESITQAR